ncbi:MAG: hypothetical protein HC897_20125 [Thermoanaerobaculia bacterium]|nr:hypothetical protein [Thermoanaerobaculia bacterium]
MKAPVSRAGESLGALAVLGSFVVLGLLAAGPAHAWGRTGHRIVGQIAANHLSPAAARVVTELLGAENPRRGGHLGRRHPLRSGLEPRRPLALRQHRRGSHLRREPQEPPRRRSRSPLAFRKHAARSPGRAPGQNRGAALSRALHR